MIGDWWGCRPEREGPERCNHSWWLNPVKWISSSGLYLALAEDVAGFVYYEGGEECSLSAARSYQHVNPDL